MLAPVDDPQLQALLHRLYGATDVPAFWAAVKCLLNEAMPRQRLSLREKALLRALHPHVEATARQVTVRELGDAVDRQGSIDGRARMDAQIQAILCRLTPAEREIVELLREGCSNKEIASSLQKSVRTVKTQLTGVYKKFGVRSRSKLLAILPRTVEPLANDEGRAACAARPSAIARHPVENAMIIGLARST